jgi:cytochrome P450
LPKDATLRITPWVVHHDKRWFDEPDNFNPDRFSAENQTKQVRGAFMPFGTDPRVCIANIFAMTELTLVATMLLQRFEFEPCGEAPQPKFNVTLRPIQGLKLRLVRH